MHSEATQTFTSSRFQIFIYFLRFIGLSYRIHQRETKNLMLFLFVYNLVIFCGQIFYGILILIGLYQINASHTQWITITHYSCITVWVISMWLNIKIHSIKPRCIDEAFSSASLSDRHIEKRSFLLKFVLHLDILFTFNYKNLSGTSKNILTEEGTCILILFSVQYGAENVKLHYYSIPKKFQNECQ